MFSAVIADDEKLICSAIKSVLEASVPEITRITTFNDGQEAYDWLQHNRADILLLDIEMPGKTGLEIARSVREAQTECYIMIITAYHDFEYAQQAIRYSVNDFITKPFSSKQLLASVQKALDFYRERSSRREENRRAQRSLLLSLSVTTTIPKDYDNICFCQNSVPLKELTCTEVTITDTGFDTVPVQLHGPIEEKLMLAAEQDTGQQTSLMIERTQELIRVLVLSREAPDLRFTDRLCQLLREQTGADCVCAHRVYSSFARYRAWRTFEKEMDFFFDLLADSSPSHAKKHLIKYVHTLTPTQLEAFSEFLRMDHQVEIGSNTESLNEALDRIIQHQLHNDSGNHIVEAAKRYMQQNYASPDLSLKSVAEALFVSSAYLSRLFKKHTGSNFSDYLLKLRMEQAQLLLRSSGMPTTAIAAAAGYENLAYFRISFKGYFGMTPSQYRQLHSSGKDVSEQ